jgi:hypothetical protein
VAGRASQGAGAKKVCKLFRIGKQGSEERKHYI